MKALLIGLGQIGLGYDLDDPSRVQTHAKALALFGFSVTAIDSDPLRQKIAFERYGFDTYDSLSDLQEVELYDLVIISTPTASHVEHLKWAIGRKAKVILMEKPLAADLDELTHVKAMVEGCKSKVMVNVLRNFDPLTLYLMGKVNPLAEADISIHYSKSLRHNGIHFLALFFKVFGNCSEFTVHEKNSENPTVEFHFPRHQILFRPSVDDDNRIRVKDSTLSLEFYLGGREIIVTQKDRPELMLTDRLNNYQETVMVKVMQCIAGEPDDSFEAAWGAQNLIEHVLAEAAR